MSGDKSSVSTRSPVTKNIGRGDVNLRSTNGRSSRSRIRLLLGRVSTSSINCEMSAMTDSRSRARAVKYRLNRGRRSTSVSSERVSSLNTAVSVPRSTASTIVAGGPLDAISPDTKILVSTTTRMRPPHCSNRTRNFSRGWGWTVHLFAPERTQRFRQASSQGVTCRGFQNDDVGASVHSCLLTPGFHPGCGDHETGLCVTDGIHTAPSDRDDAKV